jgi:hypothetical protein
VSAAAPRTAAGAQGGRLDVIIKDQTNFTAGAVFTLIGLAIAGIASTYEFGSVASMGPGFFPFWVGVLLAACGAALMLGAVWISAAVEKLGRWDLKPLAIITLSVALFGVLLDYLGLFLTLIIVLLIAATASHERSRTVAFATAIGFASAAVLLFIYGLHLPFPIWPSFVQL